MMNRILLFALGLLVAAGCKAKSLPPSDLDRARDGVQTALEAWKKGDAQDALRDRGIEAADPDWSAGERLADYMIYDAEGTKRDGIRCGVLLTLNRAGKKESKEVFYRVTLGEKVVISREK
jgi:hypothetical protein